MFVASISILAPIGCSWALFLEYGELECYEYAKNLENQLKADFPTIGNTGYNNGTGIQFQLVGSSAALYSRMVQ